MSNLDKKINEYVDTFHENVPLFVMPSMPNDELIKLLDEHIKSGKPIEIDIDPDVVY